MLRSSRVAESLFQGDIGVRKDVLLDGTIQPVLTLAIMESMSGLSKMRSCYEEALTPSVART
jgi:hypothetical protein